MEETNLTILEDVTQRVRYYATRMLTGWLQLGKALTEAKELVSHGEWEEWVLKNARMGMRMCQNCMAAYNRFGTDNDRIAGLSMTNVIALTSASDEEIEKLAEEGDLTSMTSRELKERLKKEREKGRKEGAEEAKEEAAENTRDALQCAANDKARELAKQQMRFDEEMAALKDQLEAKKAEAAELKFRAEQAESNVKAAIDGARDVSRQSNEMEAERRKYEREIATLEATIDDMQKSYDALRQEHTDTLRQMSHDDAERTNGDILSPDAVNDAVQMFIGQVGRFPHMHSTFAVMDTEEREQYRASILQIKDWADKSLSAVDTVFTEGGVY